MVACTALSISVTPATVPEAREVTASCTCSRWQTAGGLPWHTIAAGLPTVGGFDFKRRSCVGRSGSLVLTVQSVVHAAIFTSQVVLAVGPQLISRRSLLAQFIDSTPPAPSKAQANAFLPRGSIHPIPTVVPSDQTQRSTPSQRTFSTAVYANDGRRDVWTWAASAAAAAKSKRSRAARLAERPAPGLEWVWLQVKQIGKRREVTCKGQPNGSVGVPDGARNRGLVDRLRRPLTAYRHKHHTRQAPGWHSAGAEGALHACNGKAGAVTYGGDGGLAHAGPY
jgi:hypothetical protein